MESNTTGCDVGSDTFGLTFVDGVCVSSITSLAVPSL